MSTTHSFKVNSEYYVPSSTITNNIPSEYSIENILLCQYDMLDVAIYLKAESPNNRILLHNFANNVKPCDGLWDSRTQENQIYNCTNIKDSVLPIQYKLYPIQDEKKEHDNVGNILVNMLITKNCQILKTSNDKDLTVKAVVDIVSLDAIKIPAERNIDLYSTQEFPRCDYAKQIDRDKMEKRIQFLLTYAMGEGYDYLITGGWGMGCFLNPHWGLINLWNKVLLKMPKNKLKIIFCIPVRNDPDGEAIYIYQYFNEYLLGQNKQRLDFNQIDNEKRIKQEIEKLSEDEQNIKKKIYGIVWGTALGEILSYYYNSTGITENTDYLEKWKIMQCDYTMDWDASTDQTIILMRVLGASGMDIDTTKMAKYLINWKAVGFNELTGRSSTCMDHITKNILSQTDYIHAPLDVSRRIYQSKGANDESSASIGRNAINGIFKDFGRRSIICCKMLQPDTLCQAACLVHSYIINCLWNGIYITTEDWGHLISNCHKIFDTNQSNCVQHKIDFDNFWSIGRNYQYQITSGIKDFVERNMKSGPLRSPDHTLFPMTLAIILMYDIQGHILVNGKPCREMMTVTEIAALDDKMRGKIINFNEVLNADYYFSTIETLAAINPNVVCNAVIGSVLGLACWNNVYNDEVVRDDHGNILETDSQQWVKYAGYAEWLNSEIDQFVEYYLNGRRNSIIKRNEINQRRLLEEENRRPPVELYSEY